VFFCGLKISPQGLTSTTLRSAEERPFPEILTQTDIRAIVEKP